MKNDQLMVAGLSRFYSIVSKCSYLNLTYSTCCAPSRNECRVANERHNFFQKPNY